MEQMRAGEGSQNCCVSFAVLQSFRSNEMDQIIGQMNRWLQARFQYTMTRQFTGKKLQSGSIKLLHIKCHFCSSLGNPNSVI